MEQLRTLGDLKRIGDEHLAAKRPIEALKIYRLVLEAAPFDFDLRLDIGDIIRGLGSKEIAAKIYQSVFQHDVRAGSPLRAMAAIKRIEALGGEVRPSVDTLSKTYGAGSLRLGRSVKLAPPDYASPIREDLDLEFQVDRNALVLEIARLAAYLENIENYPPLVPPIQIFSTLDPAGFSELLHRLTLLSFEPGRAIIEQGKPGDAVYFIARGEVEVVRRTDGPDGPETKHLAHLGPGTLVGEMALVSSEDRSASVVAVGAVDVLELKRADVERLAAKVPQVAGAMARFTRERMINNLLSANPLFKPFDEETQRKLLGRFTGHEVPAGTIFLEQGNVGQGLYLVLQGKAEVIKREGGQEVKLADMGPGDMAGEISLLFEEPISATVRTTAPTTLLFLARELFKPLIDAVPELLAHFNRLAEARLQDTENKIAHTLDDDLIELLEEDEEHVEVDLDDEDIELDEDGIVFI